MEEAVTSCPGPGSRAGPLPGLSWRWDLWPWALTGRVQEAPGLPCGRCPLDDSRGQERGSDEQMCILVEIRAREDRAEQQAEGKGEAQPAPGGPGDCRGTGPLALGLLLLGCVCSLWHPCLGPSWSSCLGSPRSALTWAVRACLLHPTLGQKDRRSLTPGGVSWAPGSGTGLSKHLRPA